MPTGKKETFNEWLQGQKGIKRKSARDVVSRFRRASQIADLDDITIKVDSEEALFKLTKTDEFKQMTVSVRSQLKHSIRLWYEYMQS